MPVQILVVDDEADIESLMRQRFRRQIRGKELVFHFAANGRQAMETIEANPEIEMVLSDINMPVMDGLTLLRQLNEMDRPLKTIIISAYGDMMNIRAAMNGGAFDFLTKPMDFGDVEATIRKTVEALEDIKRAKQIRHQLTAIECELETAARIQQILLPQTCLSNYAPGGFRISGHMLPARQIGGDFYDYFMVDSDHLGLAIGDVSGKGVPAGLLMAMSKTLLRATALQGAEPGACLHHVNQILCRETEPAMFVTMFYGVLEIASGELRFSIGGHNRPYVCRQSGQVELSECVGGPVLGLVEDGEYPTESLHLAEGDAIFLYTDGLIEAEDREQNEFSQERVKTLLNLAHGKPLELIFESANDALKAHCTTRTQSDDITMLVLQYFGSSSSDPTSFRNRVKF